MYSAKQFTEWDDWTDELCILLENAVQYSRVNDKDSVFMSEKKYTFPVVPTGAPAETLIIKHECAAVCRFRIVGDPDDVRVVLNPMQPGGGCVLAEGVKEVESCFESIPYPFIASGLSTLAVSATTTTPVILLVTQLYFPNRLLDSFVCRERGIVRFDTNIMVAISGHAATRVGVLGG